MHELEIRFAQMDISENRNCANLFKDSRFNGWYCVSLETKEEEKVFIDTFVRFRMPSPIKIYGDVLRVFTQEERKAGIHRMLIGKDLQDEVKKMLDNGTSLNEHLGKLSEEEISELLNRMKNIVLFDCNKIPYIHIRTEVKISEETSNTNIEHIRKFILGFPDYLKIFYNTLNEKISIEEAMKESQNIISNELLTLKEE